MQTPVFHPVTSKSQSTKLPIAWTHTSFENTLRQSVSRWALSRSMRASNGAVDDHALPGATGDDENSEAALRRPRMRKVIDKFTGTLVGFSASFEPPSFHSFMRRVRETAARGGKRNLLPSGSAQPTGGAPGKVPLDFGQKYRTPSRPHAFLDINVERAAPYPPYARPTIERWFSQRSFASSRPD